MEESFIENERKKYISDQSYTFEDWCVEAEIQIAKYHIEQAIRYSYNKRNSISWAYWVNDYWTHVEIDLFDVPDSLKNYPTNDLSGSVWEIARSDYYENIHFPVFNQVKPETTDWAYLRNKLTEALYALGCKSVWLLIGPTQVTIKEEIPKPGFFRVKYEPKYSTKTVCKWMVRVTW